MLIIDRSEMGPEAKKFESGKSVQISNHDQLNTSDLAILLLLV